MLTVQNVSETCAFYERVLRMKVTPFGEQKINRHEQGHEFEPKAANPAPGSADLCFITDEEPIALIEHLRARGFGISKGPVERSAGTEEFRPGPVSGKLLPGASI